MTGTAAAPSGGMGGLGMFALGAQGFGLGMSVVGSYMSARSQRMQLEAQAAIDEMNARLSEQAAQGELMQGGRDQRDQMLKTAQLKSTQRAAMAAGNIDLGEGTALRVLTSTDVMGEVDKNTIAANALRSAWGYRMQGVNQKNSALMKRAAARSINPELSAFSSAITGAGQVAGSWYTMDKVS